jgi:hypothetical protein
MDRGLADEVVVAVKLEADEGMVTCQRVKLPEKKKRLESRRRRTEHESDCESSQQTAVERSAKWDCSNLET